MPYLSVHPGAAAFFNGTQESFMDRCGNAVYLTPMVLGALASIFAAAWRFLGVRANEAAHPVLDAFCVLPERIRSADDERQLREIEQEVDGVLRQQLARTANREGRLGSPCADRGGAAARQSNPSPAHGACGRRQSG